MPNPKDTNTSTQEQFEALMQMNKTLLERIERLETEQNTSLQNTQESPLYPPLSPEEKEKRVSEILDKLKEFEQNEKSYILQGFPLTYGDLAREYFAYTGKEYSRQVNVYQ